MSPVALALVQEIGLGLRPALEGIKVAAASAAAAAAAALRTPPSWLPAAPLRAAPEDSDSGAGGTPTPLTLGDPRLGAALRQGENLWESALGLPYPLQVTLALVNDLPEGELAEARATSFDVHGRPTGGTIALSPDAGGRGWFIDPTPADSSEFTRPRTRWPTRGPGSPPPPAGPRAAR
jgi:hypothetical protein